MRTLEAAVFRKAVSVLMFGGLLVGTIFGQQAKPAKVSPTRDDLDNPLESSIERQRESDNPLARQQWFMHGRMVDHGNASDYLYRAYQQKMMQRAMRRMQSQTSGTLSPNALPSSNWTNLGPSPLNSDWTGGGFQDYGTVGGRVTALAVDQSDASGNTVYIGSAYGGVWKTTNGAGPAGSVNWTPLIDNQATLAVNAISVQPGNSSNILVGTGEPNNAIDSYYGLGILRSTDGGLHWTLINTTADGASLFPALTRSGIGTTKFAWGSPDNANLVVAGMSSGDHAGPTGVFGDNDLGILYSTDAGATWRKASFSTGTVNRVSDVVYNPFVKKFFATMRNNGVFSSSDGITWTKLAAQPGTKSASLYRGEFALHPTKNEMYLWYVDSAITDAGIYQSTDGGATWNTISTGDLENCNVAGISGEACGVYQAFYNMYLAAVPNGQSTDLYAGAGNIFKCQISATNPDCSKNAPGSNWLVLSHAYSCNPASAPAHVHPDQHGIDFLRSNPSIIYFGNDGGVYRTLNGPGLNSGSCSVSLPFDNLNANLGSTLQFYSLAGSPADPTALVGGTQDNGSPGVDASHAGANGVTWTEVNGGDGGAVAIDPSNPSAWYTSNTSLPGPNVALYYGTGGAAMRAPGLGVPYLTSAQLGNDSSDWVTPFKLDPADPTKIIIATCRIWRGPANTATGWSAANALSNNFGLSNTNTCSSSSNTIIRTIAVGGPKTANGSQVIYAGSELGHIFATTNADAGVTSWTDRTVSNFATCSGYPCGYPISGIAIDPRDSTGKTAYASVMGFGAPHVYKTTDGGQTWANITGNLIDAPANAIAVDPVNPSILYVGTDVGLWASTDGGITWAEYGTGLPNSAVFAIDIFNNSTTHLLRVATHGRGVWSTTLAGAVTSQISVTTSPTFLTFLNQAVGSVSATQTVNVAVSGAAITVGQAAITAGFQIKSDTCSNTTVQSGGNCSLGIAFAPTSAGVVNGTLTASLSGAGLVGTGTVNLEGNGVVASGASVTPETGWWWDGPHGANNIGLNGTGFFIEYRPGTSTASPCPGNQTGCPGVFVGGFLYDSTGLSKWLISLGTIGGTFTSDSTGVTYTGKWLNCHNGQGLTAVWKQNSCADEPNGAVTIKWTDSKHATLTRPDGSQIPLTRFSFTSSPTPIAPQSGVAQNGWWWIDPASPTFNPGAGGTGYGIEVQGQGAFIVAYVYNTTTGNPIWYLTTSGATPMSSPTSYSGTWNVYKGGPQWTSPELSTWSGVVDSSYPGVGVTITFTDPTHGTMTMGGVTIPIQKFTSF